MAKKSTKSEFVFSCLKRDVIDPGLCTHCGLCAGLSKQTVEMVDTPKGPVPQKKQEPLSLPTDAYYACPGREQHYPLLNHSIFSKQAGNKLLGNFQKLYIGFSNNNMVRKKSASGGILTQTSLYLLSSKIVDGIIMVQLGKHVPWKAEAIIATTPEEIQACSQSVYSPVPVLSILDVLRNFNGKVAIVALPDQIAAVRKLQQLENPIAKKIVFFMGPYVGTNMYFESIKNFLKSKGENSVQKITSLKYRDGEWPGHLSITLSNGKNFTLKKFYYNYLIPFFVTKATLLSTDLTNELTDLSVGDAWNPKYEAIGKGFSVVISRTSFATSILEEMVAEEKITLDEISIEETIKMHAHMLEFKKRGSFIRIMFRKLMNKKTPNYGYGIKNIPLTRIFIEIIISLIFAICSTRLVRSILIYLPDKLIGPFFNEIRLKWKTITKGSKRSGLESIHFTVTKK